MSVNKNVARVLIRDRLALVTGSAEVKFDHNLSALEVRAPKSITMYIANLYVSDVHSIAIRRVIISVKDHEHGRKNYIFGIFMVGNCDFKVRHIATECPFPSYGPLCQIRPAIGSIVNFTEISRKNAVK